MAVTPTNNTEIIHQTHIGTNTRKTNGIVKNRILALEHPIDTYSINNIFN